MPHKEDCPCRACLGRQGKAKVQKAFRLRADTLRDLATEAAATGKHQNEIVEESIRRYIEMERAEMEKKYGAAIFEGKKYILADQADFTSRLLNMTPNYNNKDEDGNYWFEMSAPAIDEAGNDAVVYWIFKSRKDADGDPAELDAYDYDDIDRVEER